MAEKSTLRCRTPNCVSMIEKNGDHCHSVHLVEAGQAPAHAPDATEHCNRCGGFFNGTTWKHVCKSCGTDVEPGQLRGMFVPHRCPTCDDKLVAEQHAKGHVCRRCHTVTAYCCC